jgi:ABC-type glutathione transport system ATPase component
MTTKLAGSDASRPLLELRGLSKEFVSGWPWRRHRIRAVDGVSLTVSAGEIVALVGASGSGKSTLARLITRLMPPSAGELWWRGRNVLVEKQEPSLAYRHGVQLIFQDPYASLNPARRVRHHLERPLTLAGKAEQPAAGAVAMLEQVGLSPATEYLDRHPHQLSGGQRQRVCIARALAVAPALLIADEPTSMLDARWRGGILTLLAALVRQRGLGLLFITHDVAAARALADRVVVMSEGRVVEQGPTATVFESPRHPSTRALLAALTFARRSSVK